MAEATRVALLARPGGACEKLQAALQQAGAEIVHVADPTAGDVAALSAADPAAVLVALEPAVESALDGFDAVLQDPARIVIYDEAEVAAAREGWDAARWARHLAAKLAGHGDVLPPGREDGTDPAPASGVVPPGEPEMVLDVLPPAEPETVLDMAQPSGPEAALEVEPFAEPAAEPAAEPQVEPEPPAPSPGITLELDDAPALDGAPATAETRAVTLEYKGGGAIEEAALAPASGDDPSPAAPAFGTTLALEPHGTGAVVVLAGIGGPDAVRQFLGALPETFPRPVLVRQRLDGGRHDRLVRQLQRATPLPVELALAGSPVTAGHVYIVPDGMSTTDDGATQRFAETGPMGPLLGLPADDSALLLLSGADAAQVDEIMELSVAGALVAGQSPEECFDNAAPGAVIARGADAGSPVQLAGRVADRWNK